LIFLSILFVSFFSFSLFQCSLYSWFSVCYFFRIIKFFLLGFLRKVFWFWCFYRLSSSLLRFLSSLFLMFKFLCLLRFRIIKMIFFPVYLWKILAFDVSTDSLHLFFSFFASVFFIFLVLFLLHFYTIKMISFGFCYESSLLLMFLEILFVSFKVSLLQYSWYCCFISFAFAPFFKISLVLCFLGSSSFIFSQFYVHLFRN